MLSCSGGESSQGELVVHHLKGIELSIRPLTISPQMISLLSNALHSGAVMNPSGPASRSSHRLLMSSEMAFARSAFSGEEFWIPLSCDLTSDSHRELRGSLGNSALPCCVAAAGPLRLLMEENVLDAELRGRA